MTVTLNRQLNDQEKQIILERFGRRCFANGHAIAEGEPLQFDHIHASSIGGQSELNNIAPMCAQHNKEKGVLPLEDFRIKLRLDNFFENGEKLTLKHLLQYLRKSGD
jgi:5-methylcytosine-specific restriction endonuclease McrA